VGVASWAEVKFCKVLKKNIKKKRLKMAFVILMFCVDINVIGKLQLEKMHLIST